MADYNYQQIKDTVAKSGALQPAQSEASSSSTDIVVQVDGEGSIDLSKYQQAVLALSFSEETDTTFDSNITATAADPSTAQQLGIDDSGKNTYIPSAAGGGLLFNGDRVIVNAKEDYTMLFGQKGVAIASPNQVNIDSQKTITLFGHDRVYVGIPNRGGEQKNATSRTKTQSVGHPTQDELYEPMVLGIKFANLIEDLIVTLENARLAGPTGDAAFQPSTMAELELVKTRIPEMLSNYAYMDGISHEKIDEDRLNAVLAARASAEDFVAPTELSGTVTGLNFPNAAGLGLEGTPMGPITAAGKIANIKAIALYLKGMGVTKEGAIGFIGNVLGESQADPGAIEKKSEPIIGGLGGIGIVQWTGQIRKGKPGRRRKLQEAAGNDPNKIRTLDFQLDYLGKELRGSYKTVLAQLQSSTSIVDSVIIVLSKFEIPSSYIERNENPAGFTATINRRLGYANSAAPIVSEVYV
jgi:hypothetical protein